MLLLIAPPAFAVLMKSGSPLKIVGSIISLLALIIWTLDGSPPMRKKPRRKFSVKANAVDASSVVYRSISAIT